MTNYNKLNPQQNEIMAEFMIEHQQLAKNLLTNFAQGKATANRLWDELSKRLNAVGPPVKDVKMWKKAYADQKYQAKKKLSFNKFSKKRTGVGPFEEKFITANEEELIGAAGLEAAVEGNKSVATFGNVDILNINLSSDSNLDSDEPSCCKNAFDKNVEKPKIKSKNGADQKLLLLENNIKVATDFQANVDAKLGRLLQMKIEKHAKYMAIADLDLQNKNSAT